MQHDLAQMLQDMGRDIAIPGVELAMSLLQELLTDLKGGSRTVKIIDVPVVPAKRLGRPPGKGKSGWDAMTPEQRSAEMKRRQAVARAKRGEKIKGLGHPRNPDHPGHDAWVRKMTESNRKHWASLTPKKRKERVASMLAKQGKKQGKTARAAVDEMQVAS